MVQDTGNRLITALQKQTEKIGYFCSVEKVSQNLAVHEWRKSFKRLRALLKFYVEFPEEFPLQHGEQVKMLGEILSAARESFVNIQIFDRLTLNRKLIPDRTMRSVKEKLLEKNRDLIDSLFMKENISGLIAEFCKGFELQLCTPGAESLSKKQFINQLQYSFFTGYDIFQQLKPDSDAEKLHDLRKKLKRLWYQLDFIRFLHPRYFKLKSDQLNKITEQLGEDHDLHVFLLEIKSANYEFNPGDLLILENQVEHHRELNMLKLTPRLKQFFNESPQLFNQKMEKIFKIS